MHLSDRARDLLRSDPELTAYVAELEDLREVVERAPIGFALAAPDGRLLSVNAALCELVGRSAEELLGTSWAELMHPDDAEAQRALVRRALAGEIDRYQLESRYIHTDGTEVWGALSVLVLRNPDGAPRAFIAQVNDISERRRLEDALRHAADHDALTGLPNRRRMTRELEHQVARSERYGDSAALVLLDLDRLKRVNDLHGHPAGDSLLVRVAAALSARLRSSDVLSRFGGDEFAALLVHVTPREALLVAEQLVQAAEAVDGSLSAGVAAIGPGRADVDAVVAAADRALYRAKRAGGGRAALG